MAKLSSWCHSVLAKCDGKQGKRRESQKEASEFFMIWFFSSPKSFNNLSEG